MPKQPLGPFQRGMVRLRSLAAADLALTLRWRNQDDVRPWFLTTAVIAPEAHASWFERYLERNDDYVFVIEWNDRPVGQVSLYAIDWPERSAEFGRLLIGESDARGRGLARIATETVLDEVAPALRLRALHLSVRADNERAIRLYERCGFVRSRSESGVVSMEIVLPRADAASP